MATIAVLDDDFRSQVLQSPIPVLVDFWATWCAPCRQVAPILEELSDEFEGRLRVVKVDVDRAPLVAQQYYIQSIPTLMIFKDGEPVQMAQGALPKSTMMQFIEQTLPELAPPTIEVKELVQKLTQGGIRIVDLRPEADFARAHIRGSVNAEEGQWQDQVEPGQLAVLVDRDGRHATEIARDAAGAVALTGGILEWQISGQPTYSNEEEAKLSG
jgi:thioredoxin 1